MKWASLAFLVWAVATVAAMPTDEDVFDMERDLVFAKPKVARHKQPRTPAGGCTTNAECIRKGLPLRPPKPKRTGALRPRQSPCVQVTYKGYLMVYNSNTGALMGYLSSQRGLAGSYGVLTSVRLRRLQ